MAPAIVPGRPASAAAALSIAHSQLGAALGVLCILAWYIAHRFAAHRHRAVEVVAKVLLVAGGVILATTIGAISGWITGINDATAGWLTGWTGDSTFTAKHLGLLTALAVINVAFAAFTLWDHMKHLGAKGRSGGGSASAHWGRLEHSFNKYGWFGLGPLSVTLPAPFGVWVATYLTLLAETVGHTLGKLFGIA